MTANSQQPWSTYALHIATFTSLSFLFDPFILWLTHKATTQWSDDVQFYAMVTQLGWMMVTKYVKLHGLFVREPSDLLFLPTSILFGYFHGFIKLYALATLRMVSHVTSTSRASQANPLRLLGVAAQTVIPTTTTVWLPELAEARASRSLLAIILA